ncbi:MAG TPA: NADH-quinone oxidoreductase subunit L [Tepidisphaeraceae bacterium]|jgi:NADH-quinone oxidoreductase subunit L
MQFWQIEYSYLIPLLPLVGAILAGFLGAKILKQQSHWPIWLGVGTSAVICITLLIHMLQMPMSEGEPVAIIKNWYTWIHAGNFTANAGFLFDPLSAVMLTVVTGIGFFITVFAKGYMHGEEGYFRFFAYLGLFIFAMTCLVMGENFVMLYLGWEGVGLCSYLLIGYYYEKPAAREAAKKAFLVNRVGDFGFAVGIMLCYLAFGTVSYFGNGAGTHSGVLELAMAGNLTAFQQHCLWWIPFCLMLGAFGKSAQFPLYVWLPDAMEGPTPVSALIHAATMVTAGVYMIVRCSTLFVGNPTAMLTVGAVGCFTAIFAATIALRQFDLKKVWAYSTISQLGYMFCGVAVLAPVAGIFHLVTHAFFKALLFLSAGVVMHAMHGELDMRKMSGIKRKVPMTRWFTLIGCFALAGFFPFSGFWSKDDIVVMALDRQPAIGVILLIAAFITAYYTFRLYFRVFEGPEVIPVAPPAGSHGHDVDAHGHHDALGHGHMDVAHSAAAHMGDHGAASQSAIETGTAASSGVDVGQTHHHDHNPETPSMMIPLFVLAIGAIFAGILCLPFDFAGIPANAMGKFLGHSPSFIYGLQTARATASYGDINAIPFGANERETVHVTPMVISGLISLAGILLAWYMHLVNRAASDKLAESLRPITLLLQGKYFVDEIYQGMIVEPLRALGLFLRGIDRWIVDGIINTLGFIPRAGGFIMQQTTQRGFLQGYAVTMLLGFAIILILIFLR